MGVESGNSKSVWNGVFCGYSCNTMRPSVPHKVAAVANARQLGGTARLQRRHGYIGRHEFDGRYARAAKNYIWHTSSAHPTCISNKRYASSGLPNTHPCRQRIVQWGTQNTRVMEALHFYQRIITGSQLFYIIWFVTHICGHSQNETGAFSVSNFKVVSRSCST